jgi:hypothetical protein
MRRECAGRRAQLDADVPSIVPLVTDSAGEPRVLVEVRVDGVLVTSRLDGRAVAIDPGKHELSFSDDDGVFATRHLMIVQGERNRAIHVALRATERAGLRRASEVEAASPRPTGARVVDPLPRAEPSSDHEEGAPPDERAPPSMSRAPVLDVSPGAATAHAAPADTRRSPFAYVFGGLGLAGVGGYALLSTWGKKDNDLIASHCGVTRDCLPASVDHVHRLYLEANISGAVGLAALAASTWLFLRTPGTPERPMNQAVSLRAKPKYPVKVQTLDVQAASAGAVAMVGGTF